MASNNVDIMSQIHTFGSEIQVDVFKPENTDSTPSVPTELDENRSSEVRVNETNGEITKAVPVAGAKRRKVVQDTPPTVPSRRSTRFGGEQPPVVTPKQRPAPKSVIAKPITAAELKETSKTTRTKKLQETYQEHDAKVRELFHLTKFVTLVDYDVNAAKEDESEVFKEFKVPYELLAKAADAKTGGRVRSTRHAINSQKGALGPSFASPAVPKPATPTNPTRAKRSANVEPTPESINKRTRRNSAQPLPNLPNGHKRKQSGDKIPSLADGQNFTLTPPRIKLKYRPPEPLITHPHHIPLPKQFPSLSDYLNSYIQLDDHEDTTLEKAEARAQNEASIRDRIVAARARGWLTDDSTPSAAKKQPEPPSPQSRHDIMLKHIVNFSGLLAQERRSNISRAKRIAQMVQAHFKRLEGTDEKELKAEEKRIRRLAKQTAQEVRKKWKLAEKVVKQRRAAILAEQQRLLGKQHLNQILEHSTQLLEARRAARASESVEPSTPLDSQSLLLSDEETDVDESMEEGSGSEEDSEMEDIISTSESESEEEVGDDNDANLTVEELRAKYAQVLAQETPNEIDESEEVEDESMQVNEETPDEKLPNGDIEAKQDVEMILPEDDMDHNSIFDEDEDDDSPMDSEDDADSDGDEESEEEVPSLAKLLGGWYSNTTDNASEADDGEEEQSQEDKTDHEVEEEPGVVKEVKPDEEIPAEDKVGEIEKMEEVEEIGEANRKLEPHTPIPFLLHGQLREYQHIGLDWLASLYDNNTNGILADEMGLGKTIQTIALIAHLACEKHVWGPHLVIVPTSVILNWEMEFKKWAPGFKILTYYGDAKQREQKRKGWNKQDTWHVCITSYQLVIHDQQIFKRKRWEYMILDEAHNIKNFRSQRWQTLLNFNANHRLLLTGTPLQNNLVELWSLLYFLMPQGTSNSMPAGFANLKEFQEWFANPVDKIVQAGAHIADDEARNTVAKLHGVLRPYILRRLKQDVEQQMPAKYEHVVYCRLSKRQRYLYDDFMSRAQTRETLASGNFMSIINCLMQLRKVCNHPDLFETRPIVTSFAMSRSVITDYENTESFIRDRLLAQHPLEFVDLHTVNLRFTHHEYLSRHAADRTLQLTGSPLIARACDELEDAIKDPVAPNFTTLDGHAKYIEYNRKLSRLDRLQHIGYLSDLRCKQGPVYGTEIFRICEQLQTPGTKQVPPTHPRNTDQFLESSEIIRNMVLDVQQRYDSISADIDKFAVVTPAVVALDLPSVTFTGFNESELKAVTTTYRDTTFPLRTKLSIAFPDKRLLQYDCGKLQRLDALLRDLTENGHRALIFTQMTRVLDILEIFLNFHGYRYLRLDGATKIEQRQIMTERFNSDPKIPVFILSSRSGGLGINLTGADTVIFYDSDWNPCMDKQCQDRCHRIGQTRDVHIYRFVSEYTIEENIFKKANQKRMLDNVVITEGNFTSDFFNKVDWRDMLGDDMALNIPEHTTGDVGHGAKVEAALAAAEDAEDALAAKRAQKEMEVDAVEFAEAPTPGTPATPVNLTSGTPAVIGSMSEREASISTPDVAAPTPSATGGMDVEPQDEDEPGSVDDWMVMFIQREGLDLDEVK